jgi:hypothetical protein
MQVVENWAELQGDVLEYIPDPNLPNHTISRIKVRTIRAIEGYPNLFQSSVGQVLEIKLPVPKQSRDLPPVSNAVVWRIRRGGPQSIFIHPDDLNTA